MAQPSKFWSDKCVVVTGGTGFIGGHLVPYLQTLGATVWKTSLVEPSDAQIDLSTPSGSIAFHEFLQKHSPDVVVHLAAQPIVDYAAERVQETVATNVMGASNVLNACRGIESIQSILFVSTDKVYGELRIIRHDSVPMGVEHPYNASKLAGDILAQMFGYTFGLPITIVRHGNIYGAGDRHLERIVPKTLHRVQLGQVPVIRGDGKATRDYIHVSDIVRAYAKIVETEWASIGTIYNLGARESTTVLDLVDTCLKVLGRIDLQPAYLPMLDGEIPHQHIADSISKSKIGWEPLVDLEEGLAMTAPFYKDITWTPR